jgi:excisionase family DNA binding protein
MKSLPTQFGARENTASSRRHASRHAFSIGSNETYLEEESREAESPSVQSETSAAGSDKRLYAASLHAATGEERRDESHLLKVREVAELLSVPVSWVYGRMRKRALDRIPAYRVGKYWRFKADEVMAWLRDSRRGPGSDQMA